MQKSRTIMALANMLRLGIPRPAAYAHIRKWRRYQQSLLANERMDARYRHRGRVPDASVSTLYMSCHYGSYPVLVKALADASPARKVYCCMSTQSDEHAQMLNRLAHRHGFSIQFILGGFPLIKGIRRAQAERAPIFVLIDRPWGSGSPADTSHAFLDGNILAKPALFTLAERMQLPHRLLFADPAPDGCVITDLGPLSQRDCLRALEQRVAAHPYYFDRMFDLHKFFWNERRHDAYLLFKVEAGRYILDVDRQRSFELPEPLYRQLAQARRRHGNFDGVDELALTGQSAIFGLRHPRHAW
ncbi:hypothetical protein [Duganella sp. Dugasp56]|jgi:hypothetical protein|uniref:hypothetical protein n=1 Tax=unclassified Duganella TaxID=2636909 RepID=UPI0039AF6298